MLPSAFNVVDRSLPTQNSVGANLLRDFGNFLSELLQLIYHVVDCVFQFEDLAPTRCSDFPRQITFSDSSSDNRNIADLRGEVICHRIDINCQLVPGALNALNLRLAAQDTLCADLSGDASDFECEGPKLIYHGIDSVL